MPDRFLVTGASGCLGAWTIARLLAADEEVVAFDLADDRRRLSLVVDPEVAAGVFWVTGDIRDTSFLAEVVRTNRTTHIIHLAALQVPFCKADPPVGAEVNVTGTINVLEAARQSDGVVRGLVYASSVAVFGPADQYPNGVARDSDRLAPTSLYGVYKQANEASAKVYFDDWGVSSIGLRPSVIYGPGRDQGMTSSPTVAMLKAAAGLSADIAYTGTSTYHHADDVAASFIACARAEVSGSLVHNVGGAEASIAEIASMIESVASGVTITYGGEPLALVEGLDGTPLRSLLGDQIAFRPLQDGITETIDHFRRLISGGRIAAP